LSIVDSTICAKNDQSSDMHPHLLKQYSACAARPCEWTCLK
jgi:hypothetical protein